MGLLQRIEEDYPQLPTQERAVALVVVRKPNDIQEMGITALAHEAKVSIATVTRFVHRMGCADYQAFRMTLLRETLNQGASQPISPDESVETQVFHFYQRVMQDTYQKLDEEVVTQVVERIKKARRIYVYGLGSSGYTAEEFVQRLIRMGIAAFGMHDSHMMYINSQITTAKDIIIAISSSGSTDDVNTACTLAKANATPVYAITAFKKSPLAQLADATIHVQFSTFIDNTRFINSQLAIMYVMDIISTRLLMEDKYREQFDQTVRMITNRKLSK